MKYKIPWTGRAHYYTKEEIEVVVDVMQNATTLTQGEHLYNFERKFSKYIGAKNVFAVNSATSALELVSQICNFGKGDEIIIPTFSIISTALCVVKLGLKPIVKEKSVGRNELCPCESGKKHKKCCL